MKHRFFLLLALSAMATGCSYMPTSTQKAKADWQNYSFDEFHFSLDSPFPFDKDLGNLFPQGKVTRQMAKQTSLGVSTGFTATVSCLETKQKIQASVLDIAKGSLKGIEDKKLVISDVQAETKLGTCSGLPAAITTGTCKFWHLVPARLLIINTVKGRWLWQANVFYPNDDDSEKMAQRILKSIQIKVKDLDKNKD